MISPLLPPRGVFAVTSLIFDADQSAAIKETLLKILALAWASPIHETAPLSYAQLSELTGKSHTTLDGHLDVLRTYHSTLRLRSAGRGQFIVSLAGWEAADLLALMAWCRADNPDRPGGLFMARLRAGAEVPERFYEADWPSYGRVGEHDPDCRQRYISGPYAAFVEH